MFIPAEKEQISLPLEDARESLKSFPMESNPDSLDGLSPVSELLNSPSIPAIYTDVNVVPEYVKNELEQSILNLEEEIAQLRLKRRSLDKRRREALNKILDIKGSIRVFCRVRPFLLTDKRRIHEPISTGSEKIVIQLAGIRKEFELDKVFLQQASQDDVFVEVEPILKSALDGHNVCVFAYGQTGTGKTFTMDGTNEKPGILPRALKELFNQASLNNSRSLTFSMSMLEVYMGNLRDLLVPKSSCRAYGALTRCNQKAFGQQESTMHGPLTHANTRTAAHAAVNTAGRSFGSFTHAHAHSHDAITHTCCSKEICRIRTSMGPRHHSHEAHAALNKALTALTCSSFGKQPTHTRCTAANSDSTHAIRTASF